MTGSNDEAVLEAMGCTVWRVAGAPELARVWSQVTATLSSGWTAALLLPQSVQDAPWDGSSLRSTPAGHAIRTGLSAQPSGSVSEPLVADLAHNLTRRSILETIAMTSPDSHVFVDAGQARQVAAVLSEEGLPIRLHQCPRSASLGWGLRAALGGAASCERVFVVAGAGGFQMSRDTLPTAVFNRLPVTVILAANGILGVDSARCAPVPRDLQIPPTNWVIVSSAIGAEAGVARTPAKLAIATSEGTRDVRVIVVAVPDFESIGSRSTIATSEWGSQ